MSELVEHEHLDGHYAVKNRMVSHPVNTVVSDYIEQLQARVDELEAQMEKDLTDMLKASVIHVEYSNQLKGALKTLVSLKKIKDEHGKTPFYIKEQPLAWENARALIEGVSDE